RALPWASLLLLLGFQPQGIRAWCSEKDKLSVYVSDPDTVKFALNTFNEQSKDEYAYGLSLILSFSKVQTKQPDIFSMKLQLERTICKKHEESLDTCPFQESHERNNTITCFFTVSTQRSANQFSILKKTCSEGPPK
uniref:Cystatin domain containing 2 n=2 Tax=Nannospalax galili TaxID=1026970 RepID=A0A8C6WB81_NANGA